MTPVSEAGERFSMHYVSLRKRWHIRVRVRVRVKVKHRVRLKVKVWVGSILRGRPKVRALPKPQALTATLTPTLTSPTIEHGV